MHNFLEYYHPDAKTVTSEDSVKFKAYMNSDKSEFNRSRPVHPMYYDRDFDFMKDRNYWLMFILGSMFVMYLNRRYQVENDRWVMWERKQNIQDLPAHQYHNHGGVLVKKQFVGFEKYHRNLNDMMDWYKKSSPDAFVGK